MPTRIIVQALPTGAPPIPWAGPGLHGALMDLVTAHAPRLAGWLKSDVRRFRAFSLAPLTQLSSEDGLWGFEMGVLDDEVTWDLERDEPAQLDPLDEGDEDPSLSGVGLAEALCRLLERAGTFQFRPSSVDLEIVDLMSVGESYRQMSAEALPADRHVLQFVTPTVFRVPDVEGKTVAVPLPLPTPLFSTLWRRWSAFSPVPLDAATERVVRGRLGVGRLGDISTYRFVSEPGSTGSGFTGLVQVNVVDADRQDPAALAGMSALVRFAAFAGLGDHTAMGMGVVQPLTRWPNEAELRAMTAEVRRHAKAAAGSMAGHPRHQPRAGGPPQAPGPRRNP